MAKKDELKAQIHRNGEMLLSGNEAIALGAYEAGVKVASAYPGTPSTEIIENLSRYRGVSTEWAPNEKVALDVALGASFAGARALAAMKNVGLNVAADPLFTSSYTGVRGGLVIVVADDPSMHSSQNEQDSRNYASAAKIPMLEPSDAREAKEFIKAAYRLSEEFDTPVLLKSSTRMSHVRGIVSPGKKQATPVTAGIKKMPAKLVMLPANARKRRREVEKRMQGLNKFAETFSENRVEWGDRKRGFITSGVSYLYVKETFPEASVLKLGMVYPLPEQLIRSFAGQVGETLIVEELDPFLELRIKAMGIPCRGKEFIPSFGELNPEIVRAAVTGRKTTAVFRPATVPPRPPTLCPGCPHRGMFLAISTLGVFVAGDIGCYTLAGLKPLSAIDSCVCMGAGIGNAFGMEKALGKDSLGKIVAVIGDSTFFHSGITGLIDIVFNRGFTTVIILDNRTTGMTGHQPHPASGFTLRGEITHALDIEDLCRAIGVKHIRTVNPQQIKETKKILRRELDRPEPSVIIAKAPCALLPELTGRKDSPRCVVRTEDCTGCRKCVKTGCPAIEWSPRRPEGAQKSGRVKNRKGHARIDADLCTGCGLCAPLCSFRAIITTRGDDATNK